jgi:hypothetical protein
VEVVSSMCGYLLFVNIAVGITPVKFKLASSSSKPTGIAGVDDVALAPVPLNA